MGAEGRVWAVSRRQILPEAWLLKYVLKWVVTKTQLPLEGWPSGQTFSIHFELRSSWRKDLNHVHSSRLDIIQMIQVFPKQPDHLE